MNDFFTDLSQLAFLQYAFLAAIFSSILCGIMGSYVTVRRISSIAGAIAHSVLGGIGIAIYLNIELGITFITPLAGATVTALLSACIIGILTIYGKQREDTLLGAIWSIGMATGIIFISITRGYSEDLMSYLFGNILMVSKTDITLIIILDCIIIRVCILFYNKLLATCFDEEFTRLRGVNSALYFILLLCLTALTIVLLSQIVGIVMVIALLTLPAATAAHISKRFWQMILWSILLCMIYTIGGLAISYKPDLPAGATIILFAGSIYTLMLIIVSIKKKWTKQRK